MRKQRRPRSEGLKHDGIRDTLAVKREDLAALLSGYKLAAGLTMLELAARLGEDDAYTGRLTRKWGPEMVSLAVADRVCTKLGLELPQIYRREWVPVE